MFTFQYRDSRYDPFLCVEVVFKLVRLPVGLTVSLTVAVNILVVLVVYFLIANNHLLGSEGSIKYVQLFSAHNSVSVVPLSPTLERVAFKVLLYKVTTPLAVAVQPAALVAVTVKVPAVVVVIGLVVAPVLQEYEVPPVAVSVAVPPVHKAGLLTVGVGSGFTVTVPLAAAVQPAALVAVTV